MARSKRNVEASAPMPLRPVLVLGVGGASLIATADVSPERVGVKAYGIASIPAPWSSPFLVIDAGLAMRPESLGADLIERYLDECHIDRSNGLLIRSSGTRETLRERGHLASEVADASQVRGKLQDLVAALPQDVEGRVHWIVQGHHAPRRQGHLSNERRLSREKRDWVLETEPTAASGAVSVSVAVRRWRDGEVREPRALECASERSAGTVLKEVALWASRFRNRLHFEWLWDGAKIVLVQMDEGRPAPGADPRDVVRRRIAPLDISGLSTFRRATEADYDTIRKLKKAALYSRLGYTMPPFFVLERQETLREILDGRVSDDLRRDLESLSRRPLIIRTDGIDIPSDRHEMLPRSDEIRSGQEAANWLIGEFRDKVLAAGLQHCSLRLIAHHFIPSVASAWAKALPGSPIVRIEALWGIPEGLYWYAHDTYEVDIGSPQVEEAKRYDGAVFRISARPRHKSMFVAGDEHGRWKSHVTDPEFAWRRTIRDDAVLSEIAWTTKQIARSEGKGVSVMWFLDNHRSATAHRALPWYHESPQIIGTPRAAPRNKSRFSRDPKITSVEEWEGFKARVRAGERVERILVEPVDPRLIRDPEFAKELAQMSKSEGFVIELLGGVLSHVYYVLVRDGAKVECVDLFGEREEKTEFYKVVRDGIPSLIRERGESVSVVQLRDEALTAGLRQKLVEESFEALDAPSAGELIGELADVIEVVRSIAESVGVTFGEIERTRKKKAAKRGGFSKGYMLTVTESPHSLSTSEAPSLTEQTSEEADNVWVITNPARVPIRSTHRKPDLRRAKDGEFEKLLDVEPDFNRLSGQKETLRFELPTPDGGSQNFTMTLGLKRRGSSLRATVSLRMTARPKVGGQQLELPFDG